MHSTNEDVEVLRNYCLEYGIDLPESYAETLLRHLELVIEKNKVLNLTRIVSHDEAIVRHILDSLLFLPSIVRGSESRFKGMVPPKSTSDPSTMINPAYFGSQEVDSLRLIDIGTGAGFPGIPLAVYTGLDTTLLDSVGKKIKAVSEFVEALSLDNVTAVSSRAEEFARDNAGAFDIVVARAVSELRVLIEYASPLLAKNGLLIASKGSISDQERDESKRAEKICGLELVRKDEFELPGDNGHREVYVYAKVRKPAIKLPRNTGMAKHKPL